MDAPDESSRQRDDIAYKRSASGSLLTGPGDPLPAATIFLAGLLLDKRIARGKLMAISLAAVGVILKSSS